MCYMSFMYGVVVQVDRSGDFFQFGHCVIIKKDILGESVHHRNIQRGKTFLCFERPTGVLPCVTT